MRAAMTAFLPLSVILVGRVETKPLSPPAYVLDGISIYGRAQSLSKSQIRAAIAEDRLRSSQPDKSIRLRLPVRLRFIFTTPRETTA
jgi:hypothetical protein